MDSGLDPTKREVSNPRGVQLKRPGPPGGVRDTNRQNKSQAIRDAALALFLERGIEGVSVDDIMKAAEMAKGSFYRYFADQEGLVRELIAPVTEHATRALEAALEQVRSATLNRSAVHDLLGNALAALATQHRGELRLYLQESRAPGVGARKPISELMKQISALATAIAAADPAGAQPAGVALAAVGATERLLLAALHDQNIGELARLPSVVQRVLQSISAPS